jgi:hypothetical protein
MPWILLFLGAGAVYLVSKSSASAAPPATGGGGSPVADSCNGLLPAGKDTDVTGVMPAAVNATVMAALSTENDVIKLHQVAECLFGRGYQAAAARFYNKIASMRMPVNATWTRGDMTDLSGKVGTISKVTVPNGPYGFSQIPMNGANSVSGAELSSAYQAGFLAGTDMGATAGKAGLKVTGPDATQLAMLIPGSYATTPYANLLDESFVAGANDGFVAGYRAETGVSSITINPGAGAAAAFSEPGSKFAAIGTKSATYTP